MPQSIESLIVKARDDFDLTRAEDQIRVRKLSEAFENHGIDTVLKILEPDWANAALEAKMAALLAKSRYRLNKVSQPINIGVVFAMWGEQNRLLPASSENPNGENSLITKIDQLEWVTRDNPEIRWTLYAVDDGCPHGSAKIAKSVMEDHPLRERVCVLSLSESLPVDKGPLRNLENADNSRKAGAIILGAMRAIEDGAQAIIYTDADNSVHLGQIGLLLEPFLEWRRQVVIGNRKHPQSVLVKDAARWGKGIKTLRHMQRMAGKAIFSRGILDTQAAFKLYGSDVLNKIIATPTVYDFSFDTDWILAALAEGLEIEQVPFAFIDSFAESASITQGPMTTWETLLFGLAKAVRRYGFDEGPASEMCAVIEDEIRDYRDLENIINLLPPELEGASDETLGDPNTMAAENLRNWLRKTLN